MNSKSILSSSISQTATQLEKICKNYFQPTFDGYYNCLDTWNTFLDFIHTKERTAEWKSIITRYTLFLFLASQILYLSSLYLSKKNKKVLALNSRHLYVLSP